MVYDFKRQSMKARVKATGEIVQLKGGDIIYLDVMQDLLEEAELIESNPDYWTRLEHQYAGMVMQGMLNNSYLAGEFRKGPNNGIEDMPKFITKVAAVYAHALVEKMKEEK
jgi:hypothetical protein